jgi:predicted ester cyclase
MSVEENKAVVRRLFEGWRKGNLDIFDEILVSDFVDHHSNSNSSEAYKQACATGFVGFPDARFTVDDIVAEGDKVVVRATSTGTHTGEWAGIPPTNKQITWTQIFIFRFVGSKIAEMWTEWNGISFHQQLGTIPPWDEIVKQAQSKQA